MKCEREKVDRKAGKGGVNNANSKEREGRDGGLQRNNTDADTV